MTFKKASDSSPLQLADKKMPVNESRENALVYRLFHSRFRTASISSFAFVITSALTLAGNPPRGGCFFVIHRSFLLMLLLKDYHMTPAFVLNPVRRRGPQTC